MLIPARRQRSERGTEHKLVLQCPVNPSSPPAPLSSHQPPSAASQSHPACLLPRLYWPSSRACCGPQEARLLPHPLFSTDVQTNSVLLSQEEPPREPPAVLLSCPVPSRVKTRHDASHHWEVNKIMLMKHLLHSMSCDHRRQWPPRRPFITVKVSCSPKPIPGPNGEGLALPRV